MSNSSTSLYNVNYSYTGVEDDNENETLNDPFNPNDISIDSKGMAMDMCLRRLIQGTIILNPDFQRKEVWTLPKKSQLIESLMLKIPIPMFYVSADEKGNLTVVDGLQRLSTIRDFILGKEYLATKNEKLKGDGFKLRSLEFWKDFDGDRFNDLPVHLQNRIYETEFQFTIINPGTPEEVKRNIFKRINTGGMPLSSQEIRNALYIGKSTELLKNLSNTEEFKLATNNSVKDLRMADKELILRFLSFLVIDYKKYKKTIGINSFLSNAMIIINSYPEFESRDFIKMIKEGQVKKEDINVLCIDKLEYLFKIGMQRAFDIFGDQSFRKSSYLEKKSPINKNLFEMWGVLLSKLNSNEFSILLNNKYELISEYVELLKDNTFEKDTSRDSMKATSVLRRFNNIKQLLEKHIK
ncbi:DUF262 domain-containing protein [Lutibacter sp. A80]|uniref:DUF262 domain-containing protein n=1 Tax=Lutibacter sp. A80 TaxID=2918453 RepID=UPI001F06FC84|nr:DUF262 domain-containing protein [Lutibacter sp. A80]UMB60848.1 DUF262 domain-containing protein [Lutibacter sp. A80]